ncbi:MAG: hypothetical protein J7577_13455 [Sphingobacteriaceae bacterium]|nr:hypothetical protein [Sphingobacteriaceae bacterium]
MNTTTFNHPVHETNTGYMETFTGKQVSYLNPKPDQISLVDIAKGLSNEARFAGQLVDHYSVAQHTLLVWYLAPARLKPLALLHDAAEAYLKDIPKPLKNIIAEVYKPIELAFETVIFSKYKVSVEDMEELKIYDNQATEIEADYFRRGKLAMIQKFYEINEKVPLNRPYDQLLSLLRSEFSTYDFN